MGNWAAFARNGYRTCLFCKTITGSPAEKWELLLFHHTLFFLVGGGGLVVWISELRADHSMGYNQAFARARAANPSPAYMWTKLPFRDSLAQQVCGCSASVIMWCWLEGILSFRWHHCQGLVPEVDAVSCNKCHPPASPAGQKEASSLLPPDSCIEHGWEGGDLCYMCLFYSYSFHRVNENWSLATPLIISSTLKYTQYEVCIWESKILKKSCFSEPICKFSKCWTLFNTMCPSDVS